jgi:hypothetical protein
MHHMKSASTGLMNDEVAAPVSRGAAEAGVEKGGSGLQKQQRDRRPSVSERGFGNRGPSLVETEAAYNGNKAALEAATKAAEHSASVGGSKIAATEYHVDDGQANTEGRHNSIGGPTMAAIKLQMGTNSLSPQQPATK